MSTRVAYLTSQYPALSHAFIEAEIAALRRCGVEVVTHSVRPCPPQELRSSTMRAEAARTRTLRGTPPGEWATAIAGLARRRPDVLAAGLRLAARSGHRAVRTKTWQLFYLAEAALLYKRMRADGLRHVHAHFANVGSDVARLTVGSIGRAEDGPDGGVVLVLHHARTDRVRGGGALRSRGQGALGRRRLVHQRLLPESAHAFRRAGALGQDACRTYGGRHQPLPPRPFGSTRLVHFICSICFI